MRALFGNSYRVALFLVLACCPAVAGWKPQFAGAPPEVQAWFYSQRMTPEAQRRLGVSFESCCDAGDVFPTRFRIVNDGTKYGRDQWEYQKDGVWLAIPNDIIQRTETPTGEPVLFIYPYDGGFIKKGTPVCFKLPPTKG